MVASDRTEEEEEEEEEDPVPPRRHLSKCKTSEIFSILMVLFTFPIRKNKIKVFSNETAAETVYLTWLRCRVP